MPPTTPNDEDDALRRAIAVREKTSELRSQPDYQPLATESRNGFTIVRLSSRSPKVTTALVDDLR
ncbi:MAG TPA: hypothetical protein VGQ21_03040 [Thermoanaerobaculia bacterium]|jgi:hypothetical protein|nr:hypothetical protein [Thermoanaerobaculia bacterium]